MNVPNGIGPSIRQGISCHGLILAGGLSTRMGRDKALLPIDGRPLLARLIDAMRESLQGDIVVAVQSPERGALYRDRLSPLPEGVRFACDRVTEAGPLAGLAAGLAALPSGYAYTAACDSPELSGRWLARLLAEAAAGPDVLAGASTEPGVPAVAGAELGMFAEETEALDLLAEPAVEPGRLAGAARVPGVLAVAAKGEPLHALYHTGVASLAEEALAEGDYRLMSLLRRAGAKELELSGREKAAYGLHNLNTPEQLEKYLAGRNHIIE